MGSSSTGPRILVVGAGPFQLEILRAAQRQGETGGGDGSSHAPGLRLADHPHVIDTTDVPAIVDLARSLGVSGVVTAASDVAVTAVSAVVEALGLPGLPPRVAQGCRDKLACFRLLRAAGLGVPETRAVDGADDASAVHALADEVFGYPLIVKPRSGGGGRGVSKVDSADELDEAVASAQRAYRTGHDDKGHEDGQGGVLLQEWIHGVSVGVEAFFLEGRLHRAFVLGDQFDDAYIAPAGHSLPSDLDDATQARVVATIDAFGRALGLTTGPVNLDLRQVGRETLMIQINPRLGGNSITDLVRACYGVDLAQATVAAALGRDARALLEPKGTAPTAARLILRAGHGEARFSPELGARIEALRARADVVSLDLMVQDRAPALVRVDALTILGRVMVRADRSDQAIASAEALASELAASIELV